MILTVLSEAINADGLSTSRLRGPHLARLELIGRFHKEEEAIHNLLDRMKLGDTADLVINYILRFYAKPCCYNDIVQYLWLLDDDGKEELIDGLNEFIDSVIHQREQAGEDSDANCWAVIMNERLRRTTGNIDKMLREDRRRHVQLIVRGIMEPNRQQLAGTALAQLAAAILWNEWKVDLTRLRHYISQALGSAGGANGAGIDELGADLTLLRLYLRYCRESYSLDIPYSRVMQSPSAVYLGHFVHGGFVDPIVDLLQSVLDLGGSKKAGEIRPSTTLSVLPTVEHMENQWTAMLPPFEPKITPFFIQDEIITCSRALQSLAACQLLIKILEKCGSCRFPENASKKGKSTVPAKNDFTTHCEALQAALRNSALRLKLRLDEMEYVLKENSYNLMPKIGTDWNVELYELFTTQNLVVSDRVYKSYFNSCADIRYFLERTILRDASDPKRQ
ncbi:hypothetical protein Angca_002333 [Angiostrongylus cantonensis]|nr:hypothetical protein Angca_002333 [Angiostrongylus cantonensis]